MTQTFAKSITAEIDGGERKRETLIEREKRKISKRSRPMSQRERKT